MRAALTRTAGALLVVVAAVGVVFFVGMRTKSPPVQDAVRRLGRASRPLALRSAGKAGASASVVRHVGRTSGRDYETPVVAVPTDEGFVVALPYGTAADWLKNVLAAGGAVIVHEGDSHAVDRPEIVPHAVGNPHFPPREQRSHRLFDVNDFLVVRRAPLADA